MCNIKNYYFSFSIRIYFKWFLYSLSNLYLLFGDLKIMLTKKIIFNYKCSLLYSWTNKINRTIRYLKVKYYLLKEIKRTENHKKIYHKNANYDGSFLTTIPSTRMRICIGHTLPALVVVVVFFVHLTPSTMPCCVSVMNRYRTFILLISSSVTARHKPQITIINS